MKHLFPMMGVAALALVLVGCSSGPRPPRPDRLTNYPLRVFPQEGPVAAASPGVITKGVLTTVNTDVQGTITYGLPDGTSCEGTWSRPTKFAPGKVPRNYHGNVGTITVGSDGESANIVHGKTRSTGEGSCSNGALFMMVMIADGRSGKIKVQDTRGNICDMHK